MDHDPEQEPISDTSPVPEMGGACTTVACGSPTERPEEYEWEQNVLDDSVMKTGGISYSAIASLSDGELRAAAPRDFNPDRKVLKHIVSALKGNTADLAQTGLNLGSGAKMSTPGKIDEGKAIYGTDGQGGGCTIFKSKVCVLVVIYESGPTHATRLASEVAEYMEEQGH